MKKGLIFFLAMVLLLPLGAGAAKFAAKETLSEAASDSLVDNYYGAGALVNFESAAGRDVFLAGATVNVLNSVAQDLTVAGSNVLLAGEVGEDLRAVGGTVNLLKPINGEALVAGGVVNFSHESDLRAGGYLAGGVLNLDGRLAGPVVIRGGQVIISGTVDGYLDIVADEKLIITDKAVINGTVHYASREAAEIAVGIGAEKLVEKDYEFKPRPAETKKNAGSPWSWFWKFSLLELLLMLASSLVAFGLFGASFAKLIKAAGERFSDKLLLGFGMALALPIAGFVLLLTILLAPLSFLLGLVYLALMIIAKLGAGMLFGVWLFKFLTKKEQKLTWQTVVAGVVALTMIGWIPLLGWLIQGIFVLCLFGVLWRLIYEHYFRG